MNPQSGRAGADRWFIADDGEPLFRSDGPGTFSARTLNVRSLPLVARAKLAELIERASEPVQEEAERPTMAEFIAWLDADEDALRDAEPIDTSGEHALCAQLRVIARIRKFLAPKPLLPATRTIRADEVRPGMTVVMHGSPAVVDSAITYDNPPFDQPWVFMHWVYSDGPESVSGGRCIARGHRFQLDEPVSVLAPVPTGEGTGEG